MSGALLVYATRGTDWEQVGAVLRGAHVGWSLAVVVVSVCCHVLRAERWRVLLRPVGDVPRWPAIAATFIGFGANAVLPLRAGEIIRPAFLARRVRIPLSPTISTIVLERIFDTLLVVCCFLLVGLVYEVPEYVRAVAPILAAATAGGLVALVLMQRAPETAERVIRRVLAALPARIADALWSVVHGLMQGLGALADVRIVLVVFVYSVVLWSLIMSTYGLSFLALDVPVPLVTGSLVTGLIVAASVFLPQAPGFIGAWQAGCVFALTRLFHVPHDLAVGYSLLTWAIQMVVNVGSALVGIMGEGVSFGELAKESRGEVPEV